ncbi:hypothetical protein [Streptodolium elevatio]|uniref:Uncharacterized protein n=1 Tax=Streptodolium elevatio TaxID=3157996 RepID=A0ABV3DBT2_9ACTN
MNITPATALLVADALRQHLAGTPDQELTGVSCIAQGADAVFARVVLELGGRLIVVLPSEDYRLAKVKPHYREDFDALITRAAEIQTMPYATANRDAYTAANEALVTQCDEMFAVWDSGPSGGKGGTADVVEYARSLGKPVHVLWPDGAQRA